MMEVKGRGVNKREEKREEEALRRATAAGRTAARRGSSLAEKGLWSEQADGGESITQVVVEGDVEVRES
jgi:hypothetical protein